MSEANVNDMKAEAAGRACAGGSRLRKLRLSLLYALIVFVILLVTFVLILGIAIAAIRADADPPERSGAFILLVYFAVVSLVAGTILAFFVGARITRPLRDIMDATDRIAAGDYSVRIDLHGPDEFHRLSDKFNHMAQELGSVEMLRSDFISNFSHEFKTPIVSIRGFAKALKWDDLTDAERDEYLDIIISESERLSDLSANVLYLSRIESQAIVTDRTRFDLSEQVRRAVALLDRKMESKHIRFSMSSDECEIDGNEEMLRQVWINLLDNAVKFAPDGGAVSVRVKSGVDDVTVSVFNEGKEITPDVRKHIFDKFYQGDASHATQGNGLGLAIVKKIVDLHGGSIRVLSSDKGSTFEVTLPAQDASARESAV